MIPLREVLQARFGDDFPVGSRSTKRDDPLVITDRRDFVSIEYAVAEFLLNEMGFVHMFEKQQIHNFNGRKVDELVYAAKESGESEWTQTRRFFFDITAGYGNEPEESELRDTNLKIDGDSAAPTHVMPSFGAARLLMVLPNILLLIAVISVAFRGFSWVVVGAALIAKFWNGFARYLAGGGHPSAGFHVIIAVLFLLTTLAISLLHIFRVIHFL